jgi:hypothetical protein
MKACFLTRRRKCCIRNTAMQQRRTMRTPKPSVSDLRKAVQIAMAEVYAAKSEEERIAAQARLAKAKARLSRDSDVPSVRAIRGK